MKDERMNVCFYRSNEGTIDMVKEDTLKKCNYHSLISAASTNKRRIPEKGFKKVVFLFVEAHKAIVQYIGGELLAPLRAHGNATSENAKPFFPITPSKLRRKLFKMSSNHPIRYI